ncbi:MAG: tyrosine-type recombinase/integrase [Bacteroidetes bacterium]|nr:tyrosine-type recombinase/integrase [Bacteroidota bacterium]
MDISILCEQFCDYSISFRGQSKATVRRYKYVIGCFVSFTGITELSRVNVAAVRQLFYYGRTQRKWSVNTFIVYHVTLKVFFRWCMNQGLINFNPISDIEKPRLEQKLPKRLNKQDALRLIEVVYNYPYEHRFLKYRNHAIFSMFIFAGLRKQELLNLKYTDVDIQNLTILVQRGKGNKDRIIPISYTLAQSLKRYVEQRKRFNKTCPEFFASSNRNRGYTDEGLRMFVREIRKASGINFSIHKLRHTFATLMLEGGCDIYSLSKMMGHSDIKTTTIYLSATTELLKSQIAKHPLNNIA